MGLHTGVNPYRKVRVGALMIEHEKVCVFFVHSLQKVGTGLSVSPLLTLMHGYVWGNSL